MKELLEKMLNELNNNTLTENQVKEKLQEELLSNYAKSKLNYIAGNCIVNNFPHENPTLEWTGAVIDLLDELKINRLYLNI